MTSEEAIKKIQERIDIAFIDDEPFPEELQVAIEALEKQIPKKVLDMKFFAKCPACNAIQTKTHFIFVGVHYCDNCCQAIDWGEEKCK